MKSIKVNKEQKLKQESHAFNPTNLKTISKFVFQTHLCFKYHFRLNATKRSFKIIKKYKVASVMSKYPEAYESISCLLFSISKCFTLNLSFTLRQAGRQAGRQVGRQVGRQTYTGREEQNMF